MQNGFDPDFSLIVLGLLHSLVIGTIVASLVAHVRQVPGILLRRYVVLGILGAALGILFLGVPKVLNGLSFSIILFLRFGLEAVLGAYLMLEFSSYVRRATNVAGNGIHSQ
jgi:hypothetical protein